MLKCLFCSEESQEEAKCKRCREFLRKEINKKSACLLLPIASLLIASHNYCGTHNKTFRIKDYSNLSVKELNALGGMGKMGPEISDTVINPCEIFPHSEAIALGRIPTTP